MDASRPARGAWIEILFQRLWNVLGDCRAPHGARGLKFLRFSLLLPILLSRPARGAWIEISPFRGIKSPLSVAPRTGRVD